MQEISLHVLDVAGNGVAAGADNIQIIVEEQRGKNRLTVTIIDNGKGMPPDIVDKAADPFFTSRTMRRVGLGFSLLKVAAERCDGSFELTAVPGKGTRVQAAFAYNHIDRAPLGNMADAIGVLIIGNRQTDVVYTHVIDGREFKLDTREIKRELAYGSLTDPMMYQYLVQSIKKALFNLENTNRISPTKHVVDVAVIIRNLVQV